MQPPSEDSKAEMESSSGRLWVSAWIPQRESPCGWLEARLVPPRCPEFVPVIGASAELVWPLRQTGLIVLTWLDNSWEEFIVA
jgi:hypothetical protein